MRKFGFLFFFMCAAIPAYAQEMMTFGHEVPKGNETHFKVPRGSTLVVTNQSRCEVPRVFIGKSINTLANKNFSRPVRIMRPGDVMPMGHDQKRFNFMLDHHGMIRNITCG